MTDETDTDQEPQNNDRSWPLGAPNIFASQGGFGLNNTFPINGRPSQIVSAVISNYGNRAARSALEKTFTDVSVGRCITSGFLEEVDNNEVAGVLLGVTDIGRRQLAAGFQDLPFGPGTPEIIAARQMAISAIIRVKHPEYLAAFNGGEFPMGRQGAHPMLSQTSRSELHQFNGAQQLAYYKAVADTSKKQIADLSSRHRTLTRWVMIVVSTVIMVALVGLAIFGMTR